MGKGIEKLWQILSKEDLQKGNRKVDPKQNISRNDLKQLKKETQSNYIMEKQHKFTAKPFPTAEADKLLKEFKSTKNTKGNSSMVSDMGLGNQITKRKDTGLSATF